MANTLQSKPQGSEGGITTSFDVPTLSPSWRLSVFIHPTSDALKKLGRYRSGGGYLHGTTWIVHADDQKDGVLAEIHLVADRLSELTIIHEAVHAGAYLARTLGVLDAKKLAANYTTSQSTIMWRDEIQCRTVEIVTLAIVAQLERLNIPCSPLRKSSLY
jgi:hypothetical protein